ncbi:hypothetical protein BDY24DRAFT_411788 [Mrakia frigida]|uniref:uncharacterized protein n=1 Tax=Mrakia frigida TaxID=29902 RepID=UPI003FCC20CD
MRILFFPLILCILSIVLAARLPLEAASLPRTSITDAPGLKAIRRRQTSTKDVAQRLKEGKTRKRAEPSPGVCPPSIGFETVGNGGFEDGSSGEIVPWIRTLSDPSVAYGYTKNERDCGLSSDPGCQAFIAGTAFNGPGLITLTQTVEVCGSSAYSFSFEFGTDNSGALCTVTVSLGSSIQFTLSDPCGGDNPACVRPGNGFAYQTYGRTIVVASSGQLDVTFFFDCSSFPAGPSDFSKTYVVDKVSLVRI